MARKDTNKQYSLRKLKTGTASVAVAVAVLGAGFANQTTVKADNQSPAPVKKEAKKLNEAELYNKIQELEEGKAELFDKLEKVEEENKKVKEEHKKDHEKLEKKAEDVERHYLRQLDQDHKEQQ